jgi:hypothetical protein
MWSHYAANHTGIVIGFDTNQQPFSQIGADYIVPVVYSGTKADYVHSNVVEEFAGLYLVLLPQKPCLGVTNRK